MQMQCCAHTSVAVRTAERTTSSACSMCPPSANNRVAVNTSTRTYMTDVRQRVRNILISQRVAIASLRVLVVGTERSSSEGKTGLSYRENCSCLQAQSLLPGSAESLVRALAVVSQTPRRGYAETPGDGI